MDEVLTRIFGDLGDRVGGPLTFRLVLQPAVAIVLAIRAGLHDAHDDRSPYFWTILTRPADRHELLREGWKDLAKVFILAVLIDIGFQVMVFRRFYPFEALLVAFLLACVPYLLVRGPTDRIARMARRRAHQP
jgi:hypothetical protein